MICKNCGTNNDDSAFVCGTCGSPLDTMAEVKDEGKNFAIASLVCSIVSFLCCAVVLGPLGIIFGVMAKKKGSTSGMATAGIVLGIVGLVVWVIAMIFNVGLTLTQFVNF